MLLGELSMNQDNLKKEYVAHGYTYRIKDDLKAYGGKWNENLDQWDLVLTDDQASKVRSLCNAVGATFHPKKLSAQAQTIQNILRKK